MSHGETIEVAVEQFRVHKRALGRKYLSEQAELRLLLASPANTVWSCWTSSRRRFWMTSSGRDHARDHGPSITTPKGKTATGSPKRPPERGSSL
jgi:hypothetical protein